MFGTIGPKLNVLNLRANTWIKDQTFAPNIPARSGAMQQSPYLILKANAWSTGGSGSSIPIAYRQFASPVQANPAYGEWKLQYSLNNAAYSDAITWSPIQYSGKPISIFTGYGRFLTDNSSDPSTLLSLDVRSSGSKSSIGLSFGSTTRASWSVDTAGSIEYRSGGSNPVHNFNVGSSIGSQTLISQIYGSGYYSAYSAFLGGRVTAGSADQSVQTTLSTYGSLAVKGTLVTNSTYTLAETETFVYVDPSNSNFCTGTPSTACSSYANSTDCGNHTAVGCSWFAGNSCTDQSGTDQSTCESGRSGCTWETTSCHPADNTDQATCENQGNSFGGGCTWDTSTCPAFTLITTCQAQSGCTANTSNCSDFNGQSEGTCEFNGECTWTGGDCTSFNNTDQSTCESGHTGCTWAPGVFDCHTQDGTDQGTCEGNAGCVWDADSSLCYGTCTGVYDEASTCSGSYITSCTGNLCNGTYATGNCTGTYGANCQGTAACSNITNSGTCASETGCTWTVGVTVTLPTTANANRGNTGRVYSIMHVGSTGTVSIVGQSGQPIFQYTNLTLFKKGDKVLLHNQNISFPCSLIATQTPCQAQTGCSWTGQDCGAFSGTTSATCTVGHSGCSWSDPTCSGNANQNDCETAGCYWTGSECKGTCTGTWGFSCTGTYDNGSRWYAHSLERGLNYVEKTANYTITDIDDIVNCTANSFTITLPSAALNNGKQYTIKNTGSGTITMNTTSSQTIDGNASGTLTLTTGDTMVVVSNNSNWIIV